MQGHGLFGDARCVIRQSQLMNQLIALQLMLPAKRIRIGALLDFSSTEAMGFESGAAGGTSLVDDTAERGNENLPFPVKSHCRLSQRYAGIAPELIVDSKQQRELLLHAYRKSVDFARG